jgi:hypothetical protein
MPVSVGLGAGMTPVLYLDVQIVRLSPHKAPLEFMPDDTVIAVSVLDFDADYETL